MKLKFRIISIIFSLCFILSLSNTVAYANESEDCVYLGGMTAGFSLFTRGAEIVGVCDVLTENGLCSPSKEIGIKEGDLLLKLDDKQINNALDIKNYLSNKDMIIEYQRNDQIFIKTIRPAKDINGNYKLGVFIKDNISGIGTITYIKNNRFASLGHPVVDAETNQVDIFGGELYNCSITGYLKGQRGKAGELRGVFIKNEPIGRIDKNIISGVYGQLNENFDKSELKKVDIGKATVGDAYIFSTIENNETKKYSISIIKIDDNVDNKNFVIKVTDKDLLESTGGIVQGMSGSPIVQNGKLVGAVTHVFINDPTRGFGINIYNMINN